MQRAYSSLAKVDKYGELSTPLPNGIIYQHQQKKWQFRSTASNKGFLFHTIQQDRDAFQTSLYPLTKKEKREGKKKEPPMLQIGDGDGPNVYKSLNLSGSASSDMWSRRNLLGTTRIGFYSQRSGYQPSNLTGIKEAKEKGFKISANILQHKFKKPVVSESQSHADLLLSRRTLKLQSKFKDHMVGSKAYKLKELSEVDIDFQQTTIPNSKHSESLKLLNGDLKGPLSRAPVESVVLSDMKTIKEMRTERLAHKVTQLVGRYLAILGAERNSKQNAKKVKKALGNMFSLVTEELKREDQNGAVEAGFVASFFETCDAILVETGKLGEEKEGRQRETERQGLVCESMNTLILDTRDHLHVLPELYLINLLKGYLQTLFFILYGLSEVSPDEWIHRLTTVKYSFLTIPQNLDSFFAVPKSINFMIVDEQFYEFFKRFYTAVITLIMQCSAFSSDDQTLWKFLLDLYAIHFIFLKSAYINVYCRKICSELPGVSPEGILLRYIAFTSRLPHGILIHSEIRFSLRFDLIQMSKHYQNPTMYSQGRIVSIDRPVIKSIMTTLLNFISQRYANESEQKPIIYLITDWMKILSYYINYTLHYGNQQLKANMKQSFKNFANSMKEIILQTKLLRTIEKNKPIFEEMFTVIMNAANGLNNKT